MHALLEQSPLDGPGLILLGDVRRDGEEWDQAALAYERAARQEEVQVEALLRHAQMEVDRKRYARAVELLEAAVVEDPRPQVQRYLEQVRRLAELARD